MKKMDRKKKVIKHAGFVAHLAALAFLPGYLLFQTGLFIRKNFF
jgi:hypothetical protein